MCRMVWLWHFVEGNEESNKSKDGFSLASKGMRVLLAMSWADQVCSEDNIIQKPEDDASEGCCLTLIDGRVCDGRLDV